MELVGACHSAAVSRRGSVPAQPVLCASEGAYCPLERTTSDGKGRGVQGQAGRRLQARMARPPRT